jgi:subtilisin-like proprotein convertase family protein
LKAQYFNSYSGAKDFLQTHWPKEQQGAWQILQAETAESEEVVIG